MISAAHLDPAPNVQGLHQVPVGLHQASMVQPDPELQRVPQVGILPTC